MNKLEFLLEAHRLNNFNLKSWVVSVFSVNQQPSDFGKKMEAYWLQQTMTGYYTKKVPDGELVRITDAVPGQPLFTFNESILIPAKTLPNIDKDTLTTVGNFFFNATCIARVFGSLIPYQNGSVNIAKLENEIMAIVKDDPDNGVKVEGNAYVSDYLEFRKSVFYMTEFSQLCVWSTTAKTITPPPGIFEYRATLLEEYKDKLTDPAAIAEINKKLVAYDNEYLKGDPGGEKFLSSSKSRTVVRQKLYLMLGVEPTMKEGGPANPVTKSLSEGWDVDKFPEMMDGLRAGSFNRGAQTEKGGEAVKWLFRASANVSITKDDCGSLIGTPRTISKDNSSSLIGFSVIVKDGVDKIDTQEQADAYLGSRIMVRSSMYCKLDATDYCATCLGTLLSSNPTGISLSVSEYGSIMLGIFMSAMHGTALVTEHMDVNEILS